MDYSIISQESHQNSILHIGRNLNVMLLTYGSSYRKWIAPMNKKNRDHVFMYLCTSCKVHTFKGTFKANLPHDPKNSVEMRIQSI